MDGAIECADAQSAVLARFSQPAFIGTVLVVTCVALVLLVLAIMGTWAWGLTHEPRVAAGYGPVGDEPEDTTDMRLQVLTGAGGAKE